MTEREALKLALTVLESYAISYDDGDEAINAIKEALAQPEQEWVGLTEQEAADCWSTSAVQTWREIEAALKQKNGYA
jgi:hypothetical protein